METPTARILGGSDGFPGSTGYAATASLSSPDTELEQTKLKQSPTCPRSEGLTKQQEGSGGFSIDDWRATKLARTATTATRFQNGSDLMKSGSATTLTVNGGAPITSDPHIQQHQNMLCFSSGGGSSKSETAMGSGFPYSPHNVAAAQSKNSAGGYHHSGVTALNNTASAPPSSNVYLLSGIRGPFTPSQWLELEQQALIYKYITANEPIPRHLLIPIRIALEEAGMFAGLKPALWGWGDMHSGYYSNRTDLEPGRCRRTDGKKWRCSKDAMPDQKYCERHMNRGRHRSRKLVEAQANANAIANNNNNHHSSSVLGVNKMVSPATTMNLASSAATFGPPGGCYDFSKNFQSAAASNPIVNRTMLSSSRVNSCQGSQQQDSTAQFTFLPPSINLNSSTNHHHNSFSISNATHFPYSETTPNLFGVPSSESLIGHTTTTNTSDNKNSAHPFYTNYTTYDLNHQAEPDTHSSSLHNSYVDEWPKPQPPATNRTTTAFLWPGLQHSQQQQQPDNNPYLSMSIPMGPADFMSSTSSPTHDKSLAAVSVSPLRLSGELDQTQMFLGVGLGTTTTTTSCYQSQGNNNTTNNTPISWEVSMGGPLGEVLQSSGSSYGNSYAGECGKKTSSSSSPLNLLPSSSPTGVLQKSALISLSNSSAGSSPRATDNSKAIESSIGGQSLQ